jgi:hypothetical protein
MKKMINLKANEKLKSLGCKWDGVDWIAPKLAKDEADAIKNEFYNDMIVVEIKLHEKEWFKCVKWGYSHVRTVAGYIIASAKGRDSGAVIQDGIAVIEGKFSSGGSQKNYICDHTDSMTIKMEVSKNSLYLLDEETDRYSYEILSTKKDENALNEEKQKLLKRLSEIELELNA